MKLTKGFKKFTVCSLSLLMLMGIGANNASATHVNHYHNHIVKVIHYKPFHYSKRTLRYLAKVLNHHYVRAYKNKQHHENIGNSDIKWLAHIILGNHNPSNSMIRHKVNTFTTDNSIMVQSNQMQVDWNTRPINSNNKKALAKASIQDNSFDTKERARLVKDINQTRIAHGVRPLKVSLALQLCADYRNSKVQYAYEHYNDYLKYPHNTSNPSDNWIHGGDTHDSGFDYLTKHHYSFKSWGANAGNQFIGNSNRNGDGTPLKYNNNTPNGVADNNNDGLINHDNCQGNKNGHRKNELYKNWKYIGVGVTYDDKTHMGSYNEQFAN